MAKPAFRVVAKHKDSGNTRKVGAIWAGPREGLFNLSLNKAPNEQYNEAEVAFTIDGADASEFYLNIYEVEDKPQEEDF